MAAEDFRRFVELQASWLPFANNADLRQQALQLLGARLLDRVTDFGLTPDEIEGLLRWQKDLHQVSGPAEGDMLGGAGESSLIFSKQRHEPSTGILLQPEDDEN
jgi:hypothetical protein